MALEIRPVTHITVDAIGRPGRRVFYLQASRETHLVTLIIEKEHALALISGLDELLAGFPEGDRGLFAAGSPPSDLGLREPIDPLFRVGHMALAYDSEADLIVLVAYSLVRKETEDEQDVPAVRFWGTREQMRVLRNQALAAVNEGRPACSLCGELIDPEGHFCPRRNGHGNAMLGR
jgi:uncharacterized repeat protein (TIGR03847 family)